MQIVLYQGFSKKQNSTKQPPANTTQLTLTGTLKEPCSAMNPVFRIERLQNDASPTFYSYAYIDDLDRYYFVNDWKWVRGFWEASLTVDVLASHRTAIGEQTMYVLRADIDYTNNWDPKITDTMFPATNEIYLDQYQLQSPFTSDPTSGCYIVGIINGESGSSSVGAISYYALTSSQFGSLKQALLTNDNLDIMGMLDGNDQWNMDDMSEEVFKTMYNPFQYIASCMWFPFNTSLITSKTSVTEIRIGWWNYPSLSGYKINAQTIEVGEGPGDIKTHPEAIYKGKYMNFAPYTRCTLFSRFGMVPLDLSMFGSDSNKLTISYYIDLITGQCRARVQAYDASVGSPTLYCVTEQHFLLAVPIQLAQIGVDYLGTAATAVSAAAQTAQNALSLNVAGAISSAATGIYNTLNAAMPQMQTSGANGSFISPSTPTTIVFQFFHTVTNDIEHRGRPVCMGEVINTLSGYVQCADGEFDIDCLAEERTMIADFLTTGFFWE